jgi:2,3-bisphosphoglycerate-dependent phosphoglycerate mutase
MVRHGETDWNRENRFQGHADPPLNDAGRAQARDLAGRLATKPVAALYTSPLRRALETAHILGERLSLETRLSDALMEVDVGSWSGLTRDDVAVRFPDGYRRWLEFSHGWDDGETYDDLGQRVLEGLRGIAGAHANERVLAVTHGGPIRSALAVAEAVPFDEARRAIHVVGNCMTVQFAVRDGLLQRVD